MLTADGTPTTPAPQVSAQTPLPAAPAPGFTVLPPLPAPSYPTPVPQYGQPPSPPPVQRPPTATGRRAILIGVLAGAAVLLFGGGVAVAQNIGNGRHPAGQSATLGQPADNTDAGGRAGNGLGTGSGSGSESGAGSESSAGSESGSGTGTGTGSGTGPGTDVAAAPQDNAPTSAADAREQAAAVRGLLRSSGASRRSIQAAMNDVEQCGDVTADAAAFGRAAANRARQSARAESLDYSALPNGSDLHRTLVDALNAARQADLAFQSWANSLDGGCTRQAARNSGLRAQGMQESATAREHKEAFAGYWNDVCDTNGWPRLRETDI
jgi:hypothetical protein